MDTLKDVVTTNAAYAVTHALALSFSMREITAEHWIEASYCLDAPICIPTGCFKRSSGAPVAEFLSIR